MFENGSYLRRRKRFRKKDASKSTEVNNTDDQDTKEADTSAEKPTTKTESDLSTTSAAPQKPSENETQGVNTKMSSEPVPKSPKKEAVKKSSSAAFKRECMVNRDQAELPVQTELDGTPVCTPPSFPTPPSAAYENAYSYSYGSYPQQSTYSSYASCNSPSYASSCNPPVSGRTAIHRYDPHIATDVSTSNSGRYSSQLSHYNQEGTGHAMEPEPAAHIHRHQHSQYTDYEPARGAWYSAEQPHHTIHTQFQSVDPPPVQNTHVNFPNVREMFESQRLLVSSAAHGTTAHLDSNNPGQFGASSTYTSSLY